MNATGSVTTSYNGAVSLPTVYSSDARITILEGAQAFIGFYDASKTYLGKVGANGDINKTSGDWKYFTGNLYCGDYAPTNAVFVRVTLGVTDGTTLTTDNVETWVSSHCMIDDSKIETLKWSVDNLGEDFENSKSALSRFVNSRNLLVMSRLTENKYYYEHAETNTSYSYFAVKVESGKTYKSATMIRFISREGQGISNSDTYTYTATANETIYFTLYNNHRNRWTLCENDVDIELIGTYDAPTINDGTLKQVTGTSKSAIMSQKATTDAVVNVNTVAEKASAEISKIETMAIPSPNLYKPILDNYMLNYANGNPVVTEGYETSDYIPVKPGDVIHYQFDYQGVRRDSVDYSGYSTVRIICAYKGDKSYITDSYEIGASSYTVPQDAEYIRASFAKSTTMTKRALIKASTTDIVPYFLPNEVAYIAPKYLTPQNEYKHFSGTYSEEIDFTDLTTSAKALCLNCVINFSNLPEFELGIKNGTNTLLKITATTTTLTVFDYVFGGATSTTTNYTHGLTIADDLQIQAEMAETGKISLSICSGGEKYSIPSAQSLTRGGLGYPYFKVVSGSVDYVSVSACPVDINKYIWLFGDSYVGNDSARWAHYLNEKGYGTYMIDGYSGGGSGNSVKSLKNLLNIGHPSYIVWCLGMNDGSDSSAPATAWKSAFDEVRYLCSIYNITLIGATIPTVPSISHEYKNAYVKSLGIPYIDFASAVGAQSNGTWFSGMLSSDNVHPTAKGAKALYYAAITDFPQFAIQN